MSEHVYLLTVGLPLATVLLVFGMRYASAVQQARARLAHDDAYRQVAETAVSLQSQTATALSALQSTLSDVKARLTAIEKVLKDVE